MATDTAIIVSTGRTGTVALSRILAGYHPAVVALHEPAFSRMLRLAGNLYVAGQLSRRQVVRLLRLTVGRRARGADAPLYIEASPLLRTVLVPLVEDVLPRSRIVHVVRDPRDYVRSYINHGIFHGIKGLAARAVPYAVLKPEHLERAPARRWHEMSPVEAIAWRWQTLNGLIEDAGRALQLGSSYRRVRFEDLFHGDDPAELAHLCEWLGLDPARMPEGARAEPANASRRRVMPDRAEWPEEWHAVVERSCGSLMTRYGYSLRG